MSRRREPAAGRRDPPALRSDRGVLADPSSPRLTRFLVKLQQVMGNATVQRLVRGMVSGPGRPPEDDRERAAAAQRSLPQRIEAARGGGAPLPRSSRTEMEAALGADFSKVKVHTGPEAEQLSHDLGARAFTTGAHIFFGRDQFAPESPAGKHVLAHELTHTIQQGASAPLGRSRSGVLSPASPARPLARGVQALPIVTAVNAPAEIGVGKSVNVTATLAGAGGVDWFPAGGVFPVGVTVVSTGAKKGKITAAAGALAAAGATFKVHAKLKGTPGDDAISANILLVGVTAITFAPNPPFAKQPIAGGFAFPPGPPAFPIGTADPNRNGYGGNIATAAVVTAPAGRPATVTLPGGGASVEGTVITPGTKTGFINVKAKDNATGTFLVKQLVVNPVPVKLINLANVGKFLPAAYGPKNKLTFQSSDTTANPLNRPVGETITIDRDDFGIATSTNRGAGGPNPAPIGKLTAPANGWTDRLPTPINPLAIAPPINIVPAPGVVPGQNPIDVNNYVGPGVGATLPRMIILRQGFHHQSWGGQQSEEFDRGVHKRQLLKVGGAFIFRTEQIFPGASAPPQNDAYAGPPLVVLTAVAAVPAVPAATAIAADGQATANVTCATTVAGRNVNWLSEGPITFTAPALGAAAGVAAPAVVQAGRVKGKFRVTVQDSVFHNRHAKGFVKLVDVTLKNIAAAPKNVPAGTLVSIVSVNANPGGRVLAPTVNPAAAAAGVTAIPVAPVGPAVGLPARQVTVTRPAGFTGVVKVTVRDNVLPGKAASINVKFL